jgi:class 3 adenylate cyclase
MEADEAGTVATTMSHRRELWTSMTEKHIGRIVGITGDSLPVEFASATAKASMTKRIRMSEAVQQAKCAKPRVNHAWIAGFVAINGHWAKMTGKLI